MMDDKTGMIVANLGGECWDKRKDEKKRSASFLTRNMVEQVMRFPKIPQVEAPTVR